MRSLAVGWAKRSVPTVSDLPTPLRVGTLRFAHPTICMFACACIQTAHAQEPFPIRPIRIIVPTAAGGPTDTSARLIGQELTKRWGKQVAVENRAGAGTIIGSDLVAKSPPDGHTLLSAPSAIATNPASYKKLPYDALRDFAPITQALTVPNVIVMHPSLPAKNLKEFIALAKARPGQVMYASEIGRAHV